MDQSAKLDMHFKLFEFTEPDDITSTPETIEPGSLEWFRARAPLPLLFEALLEIPGNRSEFGRYEDETAKSACENHTGFWEMLVEIEMQAKLFETFDDPNAKAIVARLRSLTGCDGRLND